jgi:uncharacterized protein YbjT (DUF2867 family)
MKIAVAGGTGVVGRHVVLELETGGHEPVVLSRSRGVDLTTGSGLDEALAGVDAVIDVSNTTALSRRAAVAFFGAVTGRLLAAEERAGAGHHVALSIVGIDRVPLGYYQGKLRQEELCLAGRVPATVLRATQFHEFPAQLLERARNSPVMPVPRMWAQTVAAREVASALITAALDRPAGRLPDLAGPRVEHMEDLVRQLLQARGRRRLIVPVRLPGRAGTAVAEGGLLPTDDGPRGTLTFDEWLASDDAKPLQPAARR